MPRLGRTIRRRPVVGAEQARPESRRVPAPEVQYFDAVYIGTGSALGAVIFSDLLSLFDETERERLARLMATRMDAAVADLP